MESPEVLRGPAIAVPQSRRSDGTQSAARFTVEEVSDDADTPRSSALPPAIAAMTPQTGAGAMEDDSDDAAPRGGRAARLRGGEAS